MDAKIGIRAMVEADLDQVLALECASHSHPWTAELFRRELANPLATLELILVGGQLAGYLCYWLVADELEIQNVVTAAAFRRQGLARRLVERAFVRAREAGSRRLLLEVRAANLAAIELYREFGFGECGVRRGYYPDGEDAVLMSCELA